MDVLLPVQVSQYVKQSAVVAQRKPLQQLSQRTHYVHHHLRILCDMALLAHMLDLFAQIDEVGVQVEGQQWLRQL